MDNAPKLTKHQVFLDAFGDSINRGMLFPITKRWKTCLLGAIFSFIVFAASYFFASNLTAGAARLHTPWSIFLIGLSIWTVSLIALLSFTGFTSPFIFKSIWEFIYGVCEGVRALHSYSITTEFSRSPRVPPGDHGPIIIKKEEQWGHDGHKQGCINIYLFCFQFSFYIYKRDTKRREQNYGTYSTVPKRLLWTHSLYSSLSDTKGADGTTSIQSDNKRIHDTLQVPTLAHLPQNTFRDKPMTIHIKDSLKYLLSSRFYKTNNSLTNNDGGYTDFLYGLRKVSWIISEIGQIVLLLFSCKLHNSLKFKSFRSFMVAVCAELECPHIPVEPDKNAYRLISEEERVYLCFPHLVKLYRSMVQSGEVKEYIAFTREDLDRLKSEKNKQKPKN